VSYQAYVQRYQSESGFARRNANEQNCRVQTTLSHGVENDPVRQPYSEARRGDLEVR
jgi:hypothetical protein